MKTRTKNWCGEGDLNPERSPRICNLPVFSFTILPRLPRIPWLGTRMVHGATRVLVVAGRGAARPILFTLGDGFQRIDAGPRGAAPSVSAARPVLFIAGDGFQQIDAGRERGAFGERNQVFTVGHGFEQIERRPASVGPSVSASQARGSSRVMASSY